MGYSPIISAGPQRPARTASDIEQVEARLARRPAGSDGDARTVRRRGGEYAPPEPIGAGQFPTGRDVESLQYTVVPDQQQPLPIRKRYQPPGRHGRERVEPLPCGEVPPVGLLVRMSDVHDGPVRRHDYLASHESAVRASPPRQFGFV